MKKATVLSVSQFAIFFMGLFGGFFKRISPPEDTGEFWTGLATLLAGVAFMLFKMQARSLDPNKSRHKLHRLVFIALVVGVISLVSYQDMFQTRTAQYADGIKVIGSELTTRGQAAKESRGLSNVELLESNAGNPQGIWTEKSIVHSRMLLGCLYAASVGLIAFALISGCEGIKDR